MTKHKHENIEVITNYPRDAVPTVISVTCSTCKQTFPNSQAILQSRHDDHFKLTGQSPVVVWHEMGGDLAVRHQYLTHEELRLKLGVT